MKKTIEQSSLQNKMSYSEYRTLIDQLLSDSKTTGENHSENMLEYTHQNVHRMKRLDKRLKLSEELVQALNEYAQPLKMIAITEAWCGDASQSLSLFNKIAEEFEKVEFSVVLRDENLDLIDQFLTNGGRSIPIVIFLDKDNNYLNHWGPRPIPAQEMVLESIKKNEDYSIRNQAVHLWYGRDRTKTQQSEIAELLKGL